MEQKIRKKRKGPLGLAVLAGGLASVLCGPARAQTVTINVGAAAGTGLEIGRADVTVVRRSPAFVTVHAGLLFDNDQRFEFGAALMAEVEGRVGVAVEPQLRIHMGSGRVRGYLVAGVPLFVAPYTLYGASVGPGISVRVAGALSIYGELVVRAYPWGNDLPDGTALFHTDLIIGARHAF